MVQITRSFLLAPPCRARTSDIMINSRLNKMYIAFTASIMSDFCGNNGRYGDNGIPFSTLSPHSTKFHASFRASIFCVFSETRTNVIRNVSPMLSFLSPAKRGGNRYGFLPVFSVFYFIISIPRWSVSAEMAPVACAIRCPSASIKYVVGKEYTL